MGAMSHIAELHSINRTRGVPEGAHIASTPGSCLRCVDMSLNWTVAGATLYRYSFLAYILAMTKSNPFARLLFLVSLSLPLVISCADTPPATTFAADDFVRLNYNNPDAVVDLGVGLWAWPLPMDFDDDGDLDLLVSTNDVPFNGLYFFENTSGDAFPIFEPPVYLDKAIKNVQVSYVDGEPRVLVPGAELSNFKTEISGNPVTLYPSDSILKDITKHRFNQWKLVDYEHDGDLDILVGVDDWGDYGWDNAFDENGNWTNGPLHGYVYLIENIDGTYINKGRLKAGGKPIDVYGAPTHNLADFDNDGDLDLITGEFVDRLTWFENTGTREKPEYAEGRLLENANGLIKMDLEMIIPVAIDWDMDGDVDLVVGDEDGRVAFIEHTGQTRDRMPQFNVPRYFQQKADHLKFGALSTPVGVDWDEDGDKDIIAGNTAGYVAFIENLDGGYPPKWAPPEKLSAGGEVIRIMAGENGSIQGPAEAKWGYTAPAVADWDGDGLQDLIVNSIWGRVLWYRNIGSPGQPSLAPAQPVLIDWNGPARRPAWNWWDPEPGHFATQWRTTPFAIDWNEDSLTDLIMLDHEGYLSFFERIQQDDKKVLKPGQRIFYGASAAGYSGRQQVTDSIPGILRLNTRIAGGSGRRKFTFADWDRDGRLDLLINSNNISLMRNAGTVDGLVHLIDEGPVANRRLAGHTTSPTIVDWNQDGVPDLLVGGEDGHFYYLENPN